MSVDVPDEREVPGLVTVPVLAQPAGHDLSDNLNCSSAISDTEAQPAGWPWKQT